MAYSMVGCILDCSVLADMCYGAVTGISYLLGVKASSQKERKVSLSEVAAFP